MDQQIIITPELPIGTEFWVMDHNEIVMGLICSYSVYVTSSIDKDKSWHEQIFSRWRNGKAKDYYKYNFSYDIKLKNTIEKFSIEKRSDQWYLHGRKIYFSIEALKNNL